MKFFSGICFLIAQLKNLGPNLTVYRFYFLNGTNPASFFVYFRYFSIHFQQFKLKKA